MTVADRLRAIASALPADALITLRAGEIAAWLEQEPDVSARNGGPQLVVEAASWREKFWTVAPETRLSVAELAEALNVSPSWIYRRTSSKAARGNGVRAAVSMIPHRRMGGSLEFIAGEVRSWLKQQER
jgi:hypothetical protein